jgi:glycosyltransferase involved in cell wall biosynthesis
VSIDAVAVVIPVHNEEALLPACLRSVALTVAEARASDPRLEVVEIVVLDACSDASSRLVRASAALEIDARCVGTARRAGVEEALVRLSDSAPERTWIAMTDADCVVPPSWLRHQLALAADGAELVLGTVRPDFTDLSEQHARYWRATHRSGRPAGNVHGANLGIRGDVYLAAGGVPDLPEHEDVALVAAVRALGARVHVSDAHEVMTSGRLVGRTPGGYAAYLAAVDRRLRAGA